MDADFDIYGDLDDFAAEHHLKEDVKELNKLRSKYRITLKTIRSLQKENVQLKQKIENIEKSFWSLLITAKAELKRKDTQIQEIRREKDDICFRRINRYKKSDESNIEHSAYNKKRGHELTESRKAADTSINPALLKKKDKVTLSDDYLFKDVAIEGGGDGLKRKHLKDPITSKGNIRRVGEAINSSIESNSSTSRRIGNGVEHNDYSRHVLPSTSVGSSKSTNMARKKQFTDTNSFNKTDMHLQEIPKHNARLSKSLSKTTREISPQDSKNDGKSIIGNDKDINNDSLSQRSDNVQRDTAKFEFTPTNTLNNAIEDVNGENDSIPTLLRQDADLQVLNTLKIHNESTPTDRVKECEINNTSIVQDLNKIKEPCSNNEKMPSDLCISRNESFGQNITQEPHKNEEDQLKVGKKCTIQCSAEPHYEQDEDLSKELSSKRIWNNESTLLPLKHEVRKRQDIDSSNILQLEHEEISTKQNKTSLPSEHNTFGIKAFDSDFNGIQGKSNFVDNTTCLIPDLSQNSSSICKEKVKPFPDNEVPKRSPNSKDSIEMQLQSMFGDSSSEILDVSENNSAKDNSDNLISLLQPNFKNIKESTTEAFNYFLTNSGLLDANDIKQCKTKVSDLALFDMKRKISTPRKPSYQTSKYKMIGHRIEGFEPVISEKKAIEASKLKNALFEEAFRSCKNAQKNEISIFGVNGKINAISLKTKENFVNIDGNVCGKSKRTISNVSCNFLSLKQQHNFGISEKTLQYIFKKKKAFEQFKILGNKKNVLRIMVPTFELKTLNFYNINNCEDRTTETLVCTSLNLKEDLNNSNIRKLDERGDITQCGSMLKYTTTYSQEVYCEQSINADTNISNSYKDGIESNEIHNSKFRKNAINEKNKNDTSDASSGDDIKGDQRELSLTTIQNPHESCTPKEVGEMGLKHFVVNFCKSIEGIDEETISDSISIDPRKQRSLSCCTISLSKDDSSLDFASIISSSEEGFSRTNCFEYKSPSKQNKDQDNEMEKKIKKENSQAMSNILRDHVSINYLQNKRKLKEIEGKKDCKNEFSEKHKMKSNSKNKICKERKYTNYHKKDEIIKSIKNDDELYSKNEVKKDLNSKKFNIKFKKVVERNEINNCENNKRLNKSALLPNYDKNSVERSLRTQKNNEKDSCLKIDEPNDVKVDEISLKLSEESNMNGSHREKVKSPICEEPVLKRKRVDDNFINVDKKQKTNHMANEASEMADTSPLEKVNNANEVQNIHSETESLEKIVVHSLTVENVEKVSKMYETLDEQGQLQGDPIYRKYVESNCSNQSDVANDFYENDKLDTFEESPDLSFSSNKALLKYASKRTLKSKENSKTRYFNLSKQHRGILCVNPNSYKTYVPKNTYKKHNSLFRNLKKNYTQKNEKYPYTNRKNTSNLIDLNRQDIQNNLVLIRKNGDCSSTIKRDEQNATCINIEIRSTPRLDENHQSKNDGICFTNGSTNVLPPISQNQRSVLKFQDSQTNSSCSTGEKEGINTTESHSDCSNERKNVSTSVAEYVIEPISSNVVNVFVTRKKRKKSM